MALAVALAIGLASALAGTKRQPPIAEGDALLLEDGAYVLTEEDGKVLLEVI